MPIAHSLVMTGKRSTSLLQMASGSKGLSPKYHKKEISEGSYKVVWPLPSEVKKEKVSAEFVYVTTPYNILYINL